MTFLDILLYILLVAFGIVLWGICGLFICAIFRNLKPMPKKPEIIPIYPDAGLTINEYRDLHGYKPAPEPLLTEKDAINFNSKLYKENLRATDKAWREYDPEKDGVDILKPGHPEFDAKVYDQENTPWNVRHISSGKQNGKDQSDV